MVASRSSIRTKDRPTRPSSLRRNLVFIAVGIVFRWALLDVGIKWERLLELPETLIDFFGRRFLPPDWDYCSSAWEGRLGSIQMAWLGTVIGALLSLPMGFLAARNVSGGRISTLARLVLDAIRAVPELVLAIVVFIPIAEKLDRYGAEESANMIVVIEGVDSIVKGHNAMIIKEKLQARLAPSDRSDDDAAAA